jgi:hypothetical protein
VRLPRRDEKPHPANGRRNATHFMDHLRVDSTGQATRLRRELVLLDAGL